MKSLLFFLIRFFSFVVVFSFFSHNILAHSDKKLDYSAHSLGFSFAPILKSATPAVVSIYGLVKEKRNSHFSFMGDDFFKRFFRNKSQATKTTLGSGVIVRDDGVVVTNHHVIRDASSIQIMLSDKQEFDAEVIYSNHRSDIAILKIKSEKKDFPTLVFSDSNTLQVGDIVLAIGNPFGVGQSVSLGIVSALSRPSRIGQSYSRFIQTDAAINPGNSGGALINVQGQVVGINSAIYSRKSGSSGVGFAIPSNFVKRILEATYNNTLPKRPYLGAILQNMTPQLAKALHLPFKQGVLVVSLDSQSSLKKQGVGVGDVIVHANKTEIVDKDDLDFRLFMVGVGNKITLKVYRQGIYKDYNISLVEAPEIPLRQAVKIVQDNVFSGAMIGNLSPALAGELEIDDSKKGIVIIDVDRGSKAQRFGLKKGDIIVKINEKNIDTQETFFKILKRHSIFRITIKRKGDYYSITYRG